MKCREAERHLLRSLDRSLDAEERAGLDRHLADSRAAGFRRELCGPAG